MPDSVSSSRFQGAVRSLAEDPHPIAENLTSNIVVEYTPQQSLIGAGRFYADAKQGRRFSMQKLFQRKRASSFNQNQSDQLPPLPRPVDLLPEPTHPLPPPAQWLTIGPSPNSRPSFVPGNQLHFNGNSMSATIHRQNTRLSHQSSSTVSTRSRSSTLLVPESSIYPSSKSSDEDTDERTKDTPEQFERANGSEEARNTESQVIGRSRSPSFNAPEIQAWNERLKDLPDSLRPSHESRRSTWNIGHILFENKEDTERPKMTRPHSSSIIPTQSTNHELVLENLKQDVNLDPRSSEDTVEKVVVVEQPDHGSTPRNNQDSRTPSIEIQAPVNVTPIIAQSPSQKPPSLPEVSLSESHQEPVHELNQTVGLSLQLSQQTIQPLLDLEHTTPPRRSPGRLFTEVSLFTTAPSSLASTPISPLSPYLSSNTKQYQLPAYAPRRRGLSAVQFEGIRTAYATKPERTTKLAAAPAPENFLTSNFPAGHVELSSSLSVSANQRQNLKIKRHRGSMEVYNTLPTEPYPLLPTEYEEGAEPRKTNDGGEEERDEAEEEGNGNTEKKVWTIEPDLNPLTNLPLYG